jgi:hypothetical protein
VLNDAAAGRAVPANSAVSGGGDAVHLAYVLWDLADQFPADQSSGPTEKIVSAVCHAPGARVKAADGSLVKGKGHHASPTLKKMRAADHDIVPNGQDAGQRGSQ